MRFSDSPCCSPEVEAGGAPLRTPIPALVVEGGEVGMKVLCITEFV